MVYPPQLSNSWPGSWMEGKGERDLIHLSWGHSRFVCFQKAAPGGQSASFWESVMATPGWRTLHTSPYALPPPSSCHTKHPETNTLDIRKSVLCHITLASPGCLLQRFLTGLGQRSALGRVNDSQTDSQCHWETPPALPPLLCGLLCSCPGDMSRKTPTGAGTDVTESAKSLTTIFLLQKGPHK